MCQMYIITKNIKFGERSAIIRSIRVIRVPLNRTRIIANAADLRGFIKY